MSHRKTENAETEEPRASELGAVRVRPARGADLVAVIAIDAENTGVAKPLYWKERFERYVGRQPDAFFLVAEREGTMVGFIVGEVRAWEFGSPPSGWIFAVHISPSARLHGLGTLLFDEICVGFRKAGVTQVRTMIAKDAHLLLSFFRSLGMMGGPFIQLEKSLQ